MLPSFLKPKLPAAAWVPAPASLPGQPPAQTASLITTLYRSPLISEPWKGKFIIWFCTGGPLPTTTCGVVRSLPDSFLLTFQQQKVNGRAPSMESNKQILYWIIFHQASPHLDRRSLALSADIYRASEAAPCQAASRRDTVCILLQPPRGSGSPPDPSSAETAANSAMGVGAELWGEGMWHPLAKQLRSSQLAEGAVSSCGCTAICTAGANTVFPSLCRFLFYPPALRTTISQLSHGKLRG